MAFHFGGVHCYLFVTYLTSEVSGTTLGELEDDGSLGIASSLEGSDDGGGGGDVLVEVKMLDFCH